MKNDFMPRKLNPDDAKVIFHPVDYVVFDGLIDHNIRKVLILDRKDAKDKKLQRSVEKVIEKRNYEWRTLRVLDDGGIKEE